MHYLLASYLIAKAWHPASKAPKNFNIRNWLVDLEADIQTDMGLDKPTPESEARVETELASAIANGILYGNWPWVKT